MSETEYQAWYEVPIDYDRPVTEWTLEQCDAYVTGADEHHGEAAAEAGSGAMSLGYGIDGAYAAAAEVPSPSSDAMYVEARARLREALEAQPTVPVVRATDDDVPF